MDATPIFYVIFQNDLFLFWYIVTVVLPCIYAVITVIVENEQTCSSYYVLSWTNVIIYAKFVSVLFKLLFAFLGGADDDGDNDDAGDDLVNF